MISTRLFIKTIIFQAALNPHGRNSTILRSAINTYRFKIKKSDLSVLIRRD
jgi:hypothetical protein